MTTTADRTPRPTGIRAVPQTYRGVRFRSTLEADWAATLDSLDIAWEYEPEAVQLPSGEFYRPDFYLPECTTWLEVKGPHDERIDKVRELGAVAEHYPGCDRIPRPDELCLTAWTDEEWDRIGRALAAAPDGPTRVIVERAERQPVRTLRTARLKRGILLDADTRSGLRAAETGSQALIDLDECCAWVGVPWRLVVVGRPAQAGATAWEGVQGRDIRLIKCTDCGQHSFFDLSMVWVCRRCQAGGKVCDNCYWDSGPGYAAYPFVRAPRA